MTPSFNCLFRITLKLNTWKKLKSILLLLDFSLTGGGFHHCSSDRGGGFCAYADITLSIKVTRTPSTWCVMLSYLHLKLNPFQSLVAYCSQYMSLVPLVLNEIGSLTAWTKANPSQNDTPTKCIWQTELAALCLFWITISRELQKKNVIFKRYLV